MMVPERNLDESIEGECSGAEASALALSRMVDGDLEGDALKRALDQLVADPNGQRVWAELHCVGDALRSSEVASLNSVRFQARFAQCLEQEPHYIAPARDRLMDKARLSTVLPMAAVAAAIAVVVGVVPQFRSVLTEAPLTTARAPVAERPVTVVAQDPSVLDERAKPNRLRQVTVPINPYLQAHREFVPGGVLPTSAPYLRTSAAVPAGAER